MPSPRKKEIIINSKINSVLKEVGISKFDSVLVSSVVPEVNKNVIKIIEDRVSSKEKEIMTI